MELLMQAEDESDIYLFELIVGELGRYGYDEASAIGLMNEYHERFTGSLYSAANDLTPLSMDFYRHQGYVCMASRVYFYIVLGHSPGEDKIVRWHNKRIEFLGGDRMAVPNEGLSVVVRCRLFVRKLYGGVDGFMRKLF